MPSVRTSFIIRMTLGLCAVSLMSVQADDWPTFRGSDRSGVSKEKGLLQEWPKGGPPLVWEGTGAGRGYASLVVSGPHAFTLGDGSSAAQDKDEYLLCFDRSNGKLLWKTKTGPAWDTGIVTWQSSRSTPTVDGELVFALSPHGILVCCETGGGKEVWRKDLKKDFEGKKADKWGYGESPLIDGDLLLCTPGGEVTTLAALDKKTGDLKWKTIRSGDTGAGHASAVVSEVNGVRVYVQMTGSGPIGVRASDGKLLWSHPLERVNAVCPTPIVRGDLVFFAVGYKRGGCLLQQLQGSNGEVTVKEIYPINPDLTNKHGGIVLVGDYLFGDSDASGIPFCAELMTGKVRWKSRGSGNGSAAVCAADGRLYLHFDNGTMVLAKAEPEAYTEVGSFQVPGSGERPSWSHPVIADGKLYLREQDRILCFDIRAKQPTP